MKVIATPAAVLRQQDAGGSNLKRDMGLEPVKNTVKPALSEVEGMAVLHYKIAASSRPGFDERSRGE
jgi:hypothetical protein